MTATILILLGLLSAVALLVAAASHGALWYECRGTPHEARLRELAAKAGQTLPGWMVRRLFSAALAQLLLLASYPLGWVAPLRTSPATTAPDGSPCLILLHGLYHNPAAWLLAVRRFARNGFPAHHALAYDSWRNDFETTAARLVSELRGIMRAHPGRPIVLVGHSLGGLRARRLVAEPDIASACLALVTLGSPHGGSRLAALGPGRLARDIHPTSEVIAKLRDLPPATPLPCLALLSPVDAMVLPPENLRPSAASGFEVQETVICDHVQMLFSPAVIDQACGWLRRAAAPGWPGSSS